jgi:hypothetical protein
MQGQLAGLLYGIGPDDPSKSSVTPTYSSVYSQIVACGATPSSPSVAQLQANYNANLSAKTTVR